MRGRHDVKRRSPGRRRRLVVGGASACVLATAGVASAALYGTATTYPTGAAPNSVAVADVNKDTRPDLVIANLDSNSVSVLLGNGTGGFAAKTDINGISGAYAVAVGDFNLDTKPDLAVATGFDTVAVLLGNGAGGFTFEWARQFATGLTPRSVAVGDFNADGKPDLAAANAGSGANSVSVLLGNGTGGFAAKTDYPTATSPQRVAVGDFNNDGKPDLVATNNRSSSASVLLNNGTGGFGPKTDIIVTAGVIPVVVGDFNLDGKLDFATGAASGTGGGSVSVRLGNGGGGFTQTYVPSLTMGPGSMAVADVNRDGKPDLVLGSYLKDSVSVVLGNGAGGFGTETSLATAARVSAVATGDFNKDGKADVAATSFTGASVSVVLNTSP